MPMGAAGQWSQSMLCVRGLRHRALGPMWHRIRRLLHACRHGDGYEAPGSYDHNVGMVDMVSFQSMGSERMEMRKRQMSVQQEAVATGSQPENQTQEHQSQPGNQQGGRASNACCFCWCCCCSCSSWNEDREGQNRKSSFKPEGGAESEDSPTPTLEEVRCWAQSFERLMCCQTGRSAFRLFLRTEFSEENMLFWLACEDFCKETNKKAIEEKARTIYEDYISILSPKEVSLDSRVREVINRNMLEPNSHTFDDAQLQIYTLMQRDSYPRYMNSPSYKNLLNTLAEQSPES